MNMNRFTKSVGLTTKVLLVGSSVALLGAACWKGVGTNTNTAAGNGNAVANENVNTVAGNGNVNANTSGKIDTSDWVTYSNPVIGLEFEYPMPSNNMRFDFTDCSKDKCDSQTGLSYSLSFIDPETNNGYAVAGASTIDFAAGRDLAFYDVAFFKKENTTYKAILTATSAFEIKPQHLLTYPFGGVLIYKIEDLPSYPQLLDVQIERKDDMVGIYNFANEIAGFKSISIRFTPEMSYEDIERILGSVRTL